MLEARLNQAVGRFSQEFRVYAELARHDAANASTETLHYLWLCVAGHWDELAQRTEKNLPANGPADINAHP